MPEEDLVELKFRLYDGSDIGPFRYSPASTVAMLKERIVTEWPKGHTLQHCAFIIFSVFGGYLMNAILLFYFRFVCNFTRFFVGSLGRYHKLKRGIYIIVCSNQFVNTKFR